MIGIVMYVLRVGVKKNTTRGAWTWVDGKRRKTCRGEREGALVEAERPKNRINPLK